MGYHWTYGWLRYDSPAFPEPYRFYIYLVDGKVWSVSDPFHGASSSEGKPTVPKLILPKDREVFRHSPPFLDLRWYPSAGEYPIEYEVEIDKGHIADGFNGERWRRRGDQVSSERQSVSAPQLTVAFGGINPGRWRVRAKNSLDTSDWSDYRYFSFGD